jgi:hypothetical protein
VETDETFVVIDGALCIDFCCGLATISSGETVRGAQRRGA